MNSNSDNRSIFEKERYNEKDIEKKEKVGEEEEKNNERINQISKIFLNYKDLYIL